MLTGRGCSIGFAVLLLASGRAAAGPDWVEQGEAGSTLPTAQPTLGIGMINSISGRLSGNGVVGDFEDMYLIRVVDPLNFSMTVVGAEFDAQIFVFNVTLPGEAFGLLANDNTSQGNLPRVTAFATDDTGAQLKFPGIYAVAISGAGRVPISRSGPIFFFGNPTEISGPDGQGGRNPHEGWTGDGLIGDYEIRTVGVSFYDTPAPGSGVTLTIGAVFAARRRRR